MHKASDEAKPLKETKTKNKICIQPSATVISFATSEEIEILKN